MPGRYQIQTSAHGERHFVYQRDDSAAKQYLKCAANLLKDCLLSGRVDYFYFTGISLAILSQQDRECLFTLLAAFKAQGGQIIFDNNYRAKLWQNQQIKANYHQALLLADIALLTDEDEYELYGSKENDAEETPSTILKRLAPYQIDEIIIKQGKKPCIVKYKE